MPPHINITAPISTPAWYLINFIIWVSKFIPYLYLSAFSLHRLEKCLYLSLAWLMCWLLGVNIRDLLSIYGSADEH